MLICERLDSLKLLLSRVFINLIRVCVREKKKKKIYLINIHENSLFELCSGGNTALHSYFFIIFNLHIVDFVL